MSDVRVIAKPMHFFGGGIHFDGVASSVIGYNHIICFRR